MNPRIFKRRRRFYEEQEKERVRNIDFVAWTNGQYVAMAIAACLSKKHKYPDKPNTLKYDEESKSRRMTDAERFWAWAQAFNANMKSNESEVMEDASGD